MTIDDPPAPQDVLSSGTGLLRLTTDLDAAGVTAVMTGRLPRGGLAADRLRGSFDLARATTRLLDGRILEAAVGALDIDVTRPLVEGLARFRELREAARRSRSDPSSPETTVVLLEPHPLSSTHGSEVVMHVQGRPVATFAFELSLRLELGETSVVVRSGAITGVVGEVCSLSASFTASGLSSPLWEATAPKLSVQVAVRPPVEVPLVTAPDVPEPRRTVERPPVPGRRG